MVKCESLRNNKNVQIHCNQEILKTFTFLQNNCQYIYIYIYKGNPINVYAYGNSL